MDGIESARRYRAWEAEQMTMNKNFPRLVIVAMSAKNDPETVKEVKAAGKNGKKERKKCKFLLFWCCFNFFYHLLFFSFSF